MKKLRAILAMLLCLAMLFAFAGCNAAQGDVDEEEDDVKVSQEEDEESEDEDKDNDEEKDEEKDEDEDEDVASEDDDERSEDKDEASEEEEKDEEQEAEEQEKPRDNAEFDPALFGAWNCVEVVNNGDYGFSLDESDELGILRDGTFFRSWWGAGQVKATTNGNKIEGLWEQYCESLVAKGYVDEGMEMPELEITYEVSDIQESSVDDSRNVYHQKDSNDKLVLYIKGTVQESPVKTSEIDSMIVYEKYFPMFDGEYFTEACLLGEWSDSKGNTWNFVWVEETDEKIARMEFTLTTSKGITYNGDDIYCVDYEGSVYFEFWFEDIDLGEMKLISSDGNEFVFDLDGDEFVLTRKN